MSGHRERRVFSDDELRDALRAAVPEPPLDEVDWDRLHGRVMAGAHRLHGRAGGRRWWDVAAAWAPRGIPLTAAAAAAAALVLTLGGPPPAGGPPAPSAGAPGPRMTVEDALAAEGGPLLAAGSAEDALASAILYDDGEEW